MLSVVSCLGLFLLLFCLIGVFHSFIWNNGFLSESRVWISPFECGFAAQRLVENYFSYSYFLLLVFFVVFDLEVSLLLNMPFQGDFFKNLPYYVIFLFMLSIGFTVEVGKGYVEWGV